MGRSISYYLLNQDELKMFLEADDFEEMLDCEIVLFDKDKEYVVRKHGISFGQGVKAWNPMLELFIYLNKTGNSPFRELLNRLLIEEYVVLSREEIKNFWNELKQLSVQQLEDALATPEITYEISNLKGYRMIAIHHPELIMMEFMELFIAFSSAQSSNLNIVVRTD